MASGLADMGLIPFVDTFAVLLSRRCADQVWMAVAFSEQNVKLYGLYSGFTTGTNGPTHQSLEDVAIMRAFPNIVILEPADCKEMREMVYAAVAYDGPVYIRSVRGDLPAINEESEPDVAIGKAVTLARQRRDDRRQRVHGPVALARMIAAGRYRGACGERAHASNHSMRKRFCAAPARPPIVTVETIAHRRLGTRRRAAQRGYPVPLKRVA